MFISIHQHPKTCYPGTGYHEETGKGKGEGTTLNIPLQPGGGDDVYVRPMTESVLPALTRFKPDTLLISAGFDAAKAEGANQLQIFTKITIPLLWDVLTVAVVLWGIGAIKQFEFVYAFAGISPPRQIWTTAVYMYILAFGKRDAVFRMGYGTAVSVTLLILVIIFVVIARRLMYRETIEY